ncbi:MAG: hypothetical protein D6798_09655 [Deltaproteobacteria bacterium]|nr:MAG: hypothetical protein D6798_09655 [Deltaproteobacteria bacterium]
MAGILGLGLALAIPQASVAGASQARLDDVEANVVRLEQRVDSLVENFTRRRGLIGASDARARFEEAVYQFLVEDYEPAALTFYTLVDAQALGEQPLVEDAQWYLAECLFELGNYATAADAYQAIVDVGPPHPFFADAVRRLLEVYGLVHDGEAFYDVYQRYIVTGRVEATDFIRYTVAKSLWRQGEVARAKAMFAEIGEDSPVYRRARYFLGAVLADEGAFEDARAEFRRVTEATSPPDPTDEEVLQLAWLAVARMSYELGDYVDAEAAYQQIPASSPYFADQLYEQVWTLIQQEDWDEALEFLDIFLLGFPTDREAVNLKLTQGHILMKQDRREDALAAYEAVVADYTPVQERLDSLRYNRDDPARYFRMLAGADDAGEGADLPDFAVDILVDDPDMERAVDLYKAMEAEQSDLRISAALVEQVSAVLRRADRNIGTFARGRRQVRTIRDDDLAARIALVGYELDYLSARGAPEDRAALADLQQRYELLQERADEVEEQGTVDVSRLDAWNDQIVAVQELARRVQMVVEEEQAHARSIQALAFDNPSNLDATELALVQRDIDDVVADLDKAVKVLERIRSESTRTSLLAMVAGGGTDPAAAERTVMAHDFAQLRAELARYRAGAGPSDAPEVFSRLDDLWARTDRIDRRAADALHHLDAAERTELAVLRRRLDDESRRVELAWRDLHAIQDEAAEVATDIALAGFDRLQSEINETVEAADLGIVDIYWLDKTDVSDEIERLGKERAARLQALDDRFRIVRQKLQGSAEPGAAGGN